MMQGSANVARGHDGDAEYKMAAGSESHGPCATTTRRNANSRCLSLDSGLGSDWSCRSHCCFSKQVYC